MTRGLRPLHRFADEVAEWTPRALQPVLIERLPAEIFPVAVSLNALLGRLERALAGQQRFVAVAAHELLIPLAAVQMTAQGRQQDLTLSEETVDEHVHRLGVTYAFGAPKKSKNGFDYGQ